MKRALITVATLATTALAASHAWAQSSITVYGVADLGFRWSGNNVDPDVPNRRDIDSGTSVPSQIGFRGTENLGNGLTAGFVLESGIHADTGEYAGGVGFSRQSFVSLSGSFGSVALGRQYTPGYLLTSGTDPFGSVTVGQYNNVYLTEYRWNNQLSYSSPNWAGFSVRGAYTNDGYGDDLLSGRDPEGLGDLRALSIVPQYRQGPLFVGAHFQVLRTKSHGAFDGERVKVADLAASYDFGSVKLAALYGTRRADQGDFSPDTGASEARKSRQWLLGVTVPVGQAGTLLASYTARVSEQLGQADDARSNQWALGYEHALSKRTAIYATVAEVNNNDAAEGSATLLGAVGAGYNPGSGYQRGFNLGIRHAF